MPDFSYYMPAKNVQVLPVFDQTGLRKNQVLCSFAQVPDSFARRQDLKKEEAARSVWLPPLLRQIYYIFQRKANAAFPVLTFARRARPRRPLGGCPYRALFGLPRPPPIGLPNHRPCHQTPPGTLRLHRPAPIAVPLAAFTRKTRRFRLVSSVEQGLARKNY